MYRELSGTVHGSGNLKFMEGYGCKDNCQKKMKSFQITNTKGGGDLHVELSRAEKVAEVKGLLHIQEALCFIPGAALTRCIGMSL